MAPEAVDAQLTLLLEIQDLTSKVREFEAGSELEAIERDHFGIDPVQAVALLKEKIAELEAELSPPVRSRYERVSGHMERVVVPVIAGVCYGCYVSIPTAQAREQDPNAALRSCQHCGRFIYILS